MISRIGSLRRAHEPTRPNLIVPVLIAGCALIVMGGIATGLAQTDGPAISTALPIALQENETPIPTIDVTPGTDFNQTVNTTSLITIETTGDGVDEPGTSPVDNTTRPSPIPIVGGADWTLPNGDPANTCSEGTLDALLANPSALSDLLTYHVVPRVYTADVLGNTTTLVTVQGQTL